MPTPSDHFRLALLGLPSINSLDEFSATTHLSKGLIYKLSKYGNNYYFVYDIPKKNGGNRKISQPCKELKALQAWINRNILQRLSVSLACKGFEKNTCIADNAYPHIGANAVMTLDIEDFFPSVKINQVWSVFRAVGYSHRMAAILASICTFEGTLPQGSPASPKLANLVCLHLDYRILGYVGKKGVIYTRYADDFSFSSHSSTTLLKIFPFVKGIIKSEGFELNTAKTRLFGPGRQHRITGLIVNEIAVGIGRKKLRCIRSKVHNLCKYSKGKTPKQKLNHVIGWLSFVNGVDEKRRDSLNEYIKKLKIKFPGTGIELVATD
ncbi:MAG: retron St85 family RNA-directed DNA polymerase [Deltaproteobacteria bacterium]|jgi:retron-type reverse transcriptase|nr:retron St85 family RNA-directed DNA polymerase [Deltaproteobacteria bacterium]